MNIQKYRSSFVCYFLNEGEKGEGTAKGIAQSGYETHGFSDLVSLLQAADENPPHFVCILATQFVSESIKADLHQIKVHLPETQVLMLVESGDLMLAYEQIGRSVYSVINWPLPHPLRLIKELDHAATNTFYQYQNEQLQEALKDAASTVNQAEVEKTEFENSADDAANKQSDLGLSLTEDDPFFNYANYQKNLFQQMSHAASISTFLKELEEIFKNGNGKAAFFKYIGARKTLLFQSGVRLPDDLEVDDLGIDFPKLDPEFGKSNIRQVETHPAFQSLLKDVFGVENFHVFKLDVLGEVYGVLVLWDFPLDGPKLDYIQSSFALLNRNCMAVELEKRLHTNQIFDAGSQAFNKHHFFQKMSEEIARARRTSLPLSLVLLSVDHFQKLTQQSDKEDFSLLMRAIVRIVQKHSRVNDVIGRVSEDQFGLLLPHTALKGGAIKAERIRRMIESADFSQVLNTQPQVTLSLSVSEYPGVCKDADELYQTADRALYEMMAKQKNKVVMVEAPDGFIADFITPTTNY